MNVFKRLELFCELSGWDIDFKIDIATQCDWGGHVSLTKQWPTKPCTVYLTGGHSDAEHVAIDLLNKAHCHIYANGGFLKMQENFTTSSGRNILVNISEDGEPESVVIDGIILSENELLEVAEYVQEYDSEDDE